MTTPNPEVEPYYCRAELCFTEIPRHKVLCEFHWRCLPGDLQASLAQALIIYFQRNDKDGWSLMERILLGACNWLGVWEQTLSETDLANRRAEAVEFFRTNFGEDL